MNILDYIKGHRKGKDAHRLEKEAMSDPFLSDALEGFDAVKGDHVKKIEELQSQLPRPEKQQRNHLRIAGIAASILLLVGIGCMTLFYQKAEPERQLVAQAEYEMDDREQVIEMIEMPDVIESEPSPTLLRKQENRLDVNEKKSIEAELEEDLPPSLPVEAEEVVCDDVMAELSVSDYQDVQERAIDTSLAEAFDAAPKHRPTSSNRQTSSKELSQSATISALIAEHDAYRQYIKDNLRYPTDEACKGVKGKVILSFSVNSKGRPENVKVTQSLCPSADKEAIRLIEEGPDWTADKTSVEWVVEF